MHSLIAEGAIDDYRTHHTRVPGWLRNLFGVAGTEDWTIWRSGRNLFRIVECEDFDAAMRVVNASPANDASQADLGRFVKGSHAATAKADPRRSSRCGLSRHSASPSPDSAELSWYLSDTWSACG